MKRVMKNILSLVMVIVLVFATGVTAFAKSPAADNGDRLQEKDQDRDQKQTQDPGNCDGIPDQIRDRGQTDTASYTISCTTDTDDPCSCPNCDCACNCTGDCTCKNVCNCDCDCECACNCTGGCTCKNVCNCDCDCECACNCTGDCTCKNVCDCNCECACNQDGTCQRAELALNIKEVRQAVYQYRASLIKGEGKQASCAARNKLEEMLKLMQQEMEQNRSRLKTAVGQGENGETNNMLALRLKFFEALCSKIQNMLKLSL